MIRVEVKSGQARAALRRMLAELENPASALSEIGDMLIASTKQRFETKRAPDGAPWAPLSPVTVARKGDDNILVREGNLSGQFAHEVSGNRLVWGSTLHYAATHQFGARQGAYGKTRRGAPIPWGDIPARPFLGLSPEDEADIAAIITEHIERALR